MVKESGNSKENSLYKKSGAGSEYDLRKLVLYDS
jgi:hypothetical protein